MKRSHRNLDAEFGKYTLGKHINNFRNSYRTCAVHWEANKDGNEFEISKDQNWYI